MVVLPVFTESAQVDGKFHLSPKAPQFFVCPAGGNQFQPLTNRGGNPASRGYPGFAQEIFRNLNGYLAGNIHSR